MLAGQSEGEAIQTAHTSLRNQLDDGLLVEKGKSDDGVALYGLPDEDEEDIDSHATSSHRIGKRTLLGCAGLAAVFFLAGGAITLYESHKSSSPSRLLPGGPSTPIKDTPTPTPLEGIAYTGTPTELERSSGYIVYGVPITIPPDYVLILSSLHYPTEKSTQTISQVGGWFTTSEGSTAYEEAHLNWPGGPIPVDKGDTYKDEYKEIEWYFTSSQTRYAFFLLRFPEKDPYVKNGKKAFDLRVVKKSRASEVTGVQLPSNYPELKGVTPQVFIDLPPTTVLYGPFASINRRDFYTYLKKMLLS